MVAYEIARLLKTQGEEVALLALFNTPPPGALKGWPFGRICLTKRIAYEFRKLRAPGPESAGCFGRGPADEYALRQRAGFEIGDRR